MFRPAQTSAALSRDALVDVYLDIRPKLERVIARRTGSLTLAADLAQEMFFKIDTIQAPIPSRAEAERYFVRAAINASLNYIKIEARRRVILRDSVALSDPAITPSPERGVLARADLKRIEEALAELPEKCRAVFVMSRIHGYTHARIAAELGVSQSMVEKYVVRALIHCQARLEK